MSLLQAGLSSADAAARASGIRSEGGDALTLLPRLLLGTCSRHSGVRAAAVTCLQHLHSLPGLTPNTHSALRELSQALAGIDALIQADSGALIRVLGRALADDAAAATPTHKGGGKGRTPKRKAAGLSTSPAPPAAADSM